MMERTYWHKQTLDKPLFPDLRWSRPENKRLAGKLLITGGNAHGFAAPAEAFAEAGQAGIGTARVLLPDSLQRTVGRVFEAGEYAPSTPSGSFNQQALAELLAMSQWADGILLAGDFGRNSETAILLEKYLEKHPGKLTLAQDSVDYFFTQPDVLLERPETTLVLNFSQLQKLATAARFPLAFTSNMDFLHLIDALHEFTADHEAYIILQHLETSFVAVKGEVSSTKGNKMISDTALAAHAATWWLQNPKKPYEALTSSVLRLP
jgi:hypothetical protein